MAAGGARASLLVVKDHDDGKRAAIGRRALMFLHAIDLDLVGHLPEPGDDPRLERQTVNGAEDPHLFLHYHCHGSVLLF